MTTLSEFSEYKARGRIDSLLVICPNSVRDVWLDEIRKHGFDWKVCVWPTPPKANDDVFVVNYESVIYSGGGEIAKFLSWRRTMLVCDESHRIKNPQASTTKRIVKDFALTATCTRALNGTFVTEGPHEAWAQLQFCGAKLGTFTGFRKRWCKMGGYMGRQVIGVNDPEGFAELCKPFVFRAAKADWLDLPEKTQQTIRVEMSSEQRTIYRSIQQEFWAEIGDSEVTAPMAVAVAQKLSQVSAGFVIDDRGVPQAVVDASQNPKVQALRDLVAGTPGKLVVVCKHRQAVEIVKSACGRHVIAIGGSDVDAAKRAFNNDDSVKCFVMTQQTGSLGLTLLGTQNVPCSTMAFFQCEYSLLQRLQTMDRIHRHGQHYPCVYYDLVASPIDEAVLAALERKTDVVDEIMAAMRPE